MSVTTKMIRLFVFVTFVGGQGLIWAMPPKAMLALKQAGFSDATIALADREKTIETVAFTVEELVQLKKAGISEKTIQTLIRENSFLRDQKPIVYGRDVKPLRMSSASDIIALKEAGMSDEIIQAVVKVAGQNQDEDYQRSWEMLNNMGIIVDTRR
jgi:hypothetical protein